MCLFKKANNRVKGCFEVGEPKNKRAEMIIERFGTYFEYIPEKNNKTVRCKSLMTDETISLNLNDFNKIIG